MFDTNSFDESENPKYFQCWPDFFKSLMIHYTIPFNRFISHLIAHFTYLAVLAITVLNPLDTANQVDVDWYDYLLPLLTIAYLFVDIRQLCVNMRVRSSLMNLFYNLIFHVCVFLGVILRVVGFIYECMEHKNLSVNDWQIALTNCSVDNPASPEYDKWTSAVTYGYGFIGIGIVMGTLKILYWTQLVHTIGPLVISIKSVYKDIFLVGVAYALFLFSFSLGMKFVMDLSAFDTCKFEDTLTNGSLVPFSLDKEANQFTKFEYALKTSLWSLFDPGHPEVVGCSTGFPRYLAMSMWFIYQASIVMILMNLLIAMMNSTINSIQAEKIVEWKFARTDIWLQFYDKQMVLPVPLNLLEFLFHFCQAIYHNFTGQELYPYINKSDTNARLG